MASPFMKDSSAVGDIVWIVLACTLALIGICVLGSMGRKKHQENQVKEEV
jgi:hypothetical protein